MLKRLNIIFGAGFYGRKLYKYFISEKQEIDYFCQTEIEDNQYLMQIPIISINQLASMDGINVYIAIKDKYESKKIKSQLEEILGKNNNIFEYGNYIRIN